MFQNLKSRGYVILKNEIWSPLVKIHTTKTEKISHHKKKRRPSLLSGVSKVTGALKASMPYFT